MYLVLIKKCMEKELLYSESLESLKNDVQYIADKPFETPDSTLKTLWFHSRGETVKIESVSGISMEDLPLLSENEKEKLCYYIEERKKNVPLAFILGYQTFMGLDFLVDKRALIPRVETEILAHTAINILSDYHCLNGKFKVIDVCCGSGNVGLAIAKSMENVEVYLSDITEDAVLLTNDNIKYLGLTGKAVVFQGDFLNAFENSDFYNNVDLIVCNPPYIPSSKVPKMHDEISNNEPKEAFDGGMMGIKIIQRLISESTHFLRKGAWVAFEIGLGQGDFVLKFMERSGKFSAIHTAKDAEGNVRVVYAKK